MDRPVIYMGNNTILTKLIEGQKIYVDTRDVSVAPHIILDGMWETWVKNVFIKSIRPNDIVLDIGANCGYYTLLAASKVGTNGHVHSFEPNPFHHKNIRNSAMINGFGNVTLHEVALGKETGVGTLYIPDELTGSASLSKIRYPLLHERSIDVVRLVDVIDTKVDVIKMDVEGHEPFIIDDIIEISKRSERLEIIMEYNPVSWLANDKEPREVLDKFKQEGFVFGIIDYNGTVRRIEMDELTTMDLKEHIDIKVWRG